MNNIKLLEKRDKLWDQLRSIFNKLGKRLSNKYNKILSELIEVEIELEK